MLVLSRKSRESVVVGGSGGVEQLTERLAAEVAAATERIHALQTKRPKSFLGRNSDSCVSWP